MPAAPALKNTTTKNPAPKQVNLNTNNNSLSNRRSSLASATKDLTNDEIPAAEEKALFEVFNPKQYPDGTTSEIELKKISEIIAIMSNSYTDKIENPAIFDPVFDEGKKEEKKPPPKKDAKGKIIVEEEPAPVIPDPIDYSELLMRGKRLVSRVPLHFNLAQLYRTSLEIVPAPVYPDPNTEPVAEPVYH